MLRVMPVFGTRPEAIKMAPLVKELENQKDIECVVCVTAQHREMLDQVLGQFQIIPQYDLDIMKSGQTLTSITSGVMGGIDEVIKKVHPNLILVHGDTTTSFAAALSAFYNKIPVGHVEAGLRSFDKYSPFPEEMNRTLTSKIAELHFTPTHANKENLQRENVKDNIFVTGNTVIDALNQMVTKNYVFTDKELSKICNENSSNRRLVLLTAHRRENLGEPLKNICNAVKRIVLENEDVEVIYPMHLNPAVRNCVNPILSGIDRVHLIEPLEVQDMHNLMSRCYMIMTDSGGLQEEAPALGKPVIVLRNETERPEICAAGKAILAGVEQENIYNHATVLLQDEQVYKKMQNAINPYGDGKASERIVQAICYWSGISDQRPCDYIT